MSTRALQPSPTSVRYVKNGARGQWWRTAKANRQIHVGWPKIPRNLLLHPNFAVLKQLIEDEFGQHRGATADFNALRCLLDFPSQHLWITFEDGYLWWCTVRDGAEINPNGMDKDNGNFWLACECPWSNHSIKGKLLAIANLPGTVTTVAGFQGTVCTPRDWRAILRVIHDEKDPDAAKAADARGEYEQAVLRIVRRLSPKDFEQLIDLILIRSGWTRVASLGGTREGIDLEVENLAAGEIAFVQVKSSATKGILDDYIGRFAKRRERYARMIFAVHSPKCTLSPPAGLPVQVWTGDRVAQLVVRLGLGEWVASKLA